MDMINIDPLTAGGIVPKEVINKLIPYFYGYPLCLYCKGKLEEIKKPNIQKLIYDLQEFLNSPIVRLHHGAREGVFTVLFSLYKEFVLSKKRAPVVLLDRNTHYSMILAVERSLMKPVLIGQVKDDYSLKFNIEEDIEKVKEEHKKLPLAIILTYPDGNYGNYPDIKEVIKVAKEFEIPIILDAAYHIGRAPFDLKKMNVDVAIASCHKSCACIGPLGIIAMNEEVGNIVIKKSKYKENKEIELLGCSSRGLPTLCLLEVLPYLKERVKKWDEKVKIANYFIKKAEEELNFKLLGERPHKHDLLHFSTPNLYEISKKRKERGYFLYKELKKRNIIGISPGKTKEIKLSTYLLDKEKVDYVINSFKEILSG